METKAELAQAHPRPVAAFDLPASCVLYHDQALIAVDKPAGIPCQSPDDSQPDDLPRLLQRRLARERGAGEAAVYLGTHQRLDQDTSGAILYSLERTANASLAEQFAGRTIEKTYLAAVSGEPPAPGCTLSHWLVPDERGRMRVSSADAKGAKRAHTLVLAVERCADRSLLTLRIETGRTHQIRVQLAAIGCPVVGDPWYGGAPAFRLMLHASGLSLTHPTSGAALRITSDAPLEFATFLRRGTFDVFDDDALLRRALELAAARRVGLLRAYESGETTAFRWVNGIADGVPDTYVDVYERWLVIRVDGDERVADERKLSAALAAFGFAGAQLKRHPRQANQLVDPNDARVAPQAPLFGSPAPERVIAYEHGMPFEVHLREGLRSGLFLDQRDNRARLRELTAGKRVLNVFGYTGSFSVAALMGGAAHVVTVDVSRTALEWAARNVERIGGSSRHSNLAQDAFIALRDLAASDERFDCIVLDPPSYSTTKRGRFRAVKDYAALCATALAVLERDGVLLACVNHHGISRAALRRFVQSAAREAGRSIVSMHDQPTQRDFPPEHGAEPAMKSVIVRFGERPRMRSPSASMKQRKWSR